MPIRLRKSRACQRTLKSPPVSRTVSTLRLSDAEESGGKGANMGELVAAALHRESLTQVDNSARVDVTERLGWLR